MRAIAALSLYVSLAGTCFAGDWLAAHRLGVEAFEKSQFGDAAAAFENCLPLAQTVIERATTENDYAISLHALGRDAEARQWFGRALAIWRTSPAQRDQLAETSLSLSELERAMGDYAEAEKTLAGGLENSLTPPYEATLRNAFGDILREQGRVAESRAQFTATLALEGIAPLRRAEALGGVADLDRQAGRWDESIAGWNQTLELARRENLNHFEALALRGLGVTYSIKGDLSKSEPVLRRALALMEADPKTPPQQYADAVSCLANLYRRQQKLSLAEDFLRRALDIDTKTLGEEHPRSAIIMESLAELCSFEKRRDEAWQYATRAYSIMRRQYGPGSVLTATALVIVAIVKQRQNDLASAAVDYADALQIYRSNNAGSHNSAVDALNRYAAVLSALHRDREAQRVRAEIKAFRR